MLPLPLWQVVWSFFPLGRFGKQIIAAVAAILVAQGPMLRDSNGQEALPRLVVLTDIGGDPDDQQSLVRLMLYSKDFKIEALIASAVRQNHTPEGPSTRPQMIHEIVDAYEQVLPNLKRHASAWPEAHALRAVVMSGNPRYGRDAIGAEHATEASQKLIELIDAGRPDQPLNISIWGGQTDLAPALWQVKHERDEPAWKDFVAKFRVYDINDQDDIADWMREEFPGMFYILSKAPKGSDKRTATYRGMYLIGDESLSSLGWVTDHVLTKGPLGKLYPTKTWTAPNPHGCLKEGDTPSWFFFLPLGGNNPADPSQPGWGGQFVRQADGWYRDLAATPEFDPRETVSSRRPAFQSDFARRMAWCLP